MPPRSGGQPEPPGPQTPYPERAVYVISVAADLAGVHPQTLRIYERKGLLSPQRTAGNTRRYSERDVERLRQIQRLTQDEGVNLAGVRIIMDMQRQLEELRAALEGTRRRLAEQRADDAGAGAAGDRAGPAPRAVRPHWGVLARLDDVRSIYGPFPR
jgi:MerR family transcriptional regulator/heat shock protein HspR